MGANSGETQEPIAELCYQRASTPGSQINIPFIPRSSGSYTSSNILNCTNRSDASSSVIPLSSGSCKANCNSTLEDDIPSLRNSSGSCTRSFTKSNMSTPGTLCRICFDGDAEEKLVSPCLCAGTQGLVHKSCLERWLSTASYDKCELCHFPFHLRKKPKTFLKFLSHEWEPDMRRAVTGDLLCFLVLTPLTLVSAYLCGRGAIQYFTDRDYFANRNLESDQDKSIFSSPFSKRYRDRQILRERVILKTSIGAAYVENGNSYENENKFNSYDIETEPLYMEATGLILLAVMLVVIYSCWLAIAVSYHVKAFRRWQRVHQDLVLVDVSNPGPICRINLSFMSNSSPNITEYPHIYTLPESSYVDLDEQREQRMSLVSQDNNESGRLSIFSQSNSSNVVDSSWKKSNFRGRIASECIRKLSESGRKSSILLSRRASEGGRRASIFSACLIRENSPTRCLKYELSEKALLDTTKNSSIKRYGTVNSLNISPSKKYLEGDCINYNESKSPGKIYNGATMIVNEFTKPSKANTNTLTKKENAQISISPVAPEVSFPIYLEDYESPESYRIACTMYACTMYEEEQMAKSPERFIGLNQFPFSPSRFNHNRRESTRSTHF